MILNFDEPLITEIVERSGSIVIKSPNYDNDDSENQQEEISASRSRI